MATAWKGRKSTVGDTASGLRRGTEMTATDTTGSFSPQLRSSFKRLLCSRQPSSSRSQSSASYSVLDRSPLLMLTSNHFQQHRSSVAGPFSAPVTTGDQVAPFLDVKQPRRCRERSLTPTPTSEDDGSGKTQLRLSKSCEMSPRRRRSSSVVANKSVALAAAAAVDAVTGGNSKKRSTATLYEEEFAAAHLLLADCIHCVLIYFRKKQAVKNEIQNAVKRYARTLEQGSCRGRRPEHCQSRKTFSEGTRVSYTPDIIVSSVSGDEDNTSLVSSPTLGQTNSKFEYDSSANSSDTSRPESPVTAAGCSISPEDPTSELNETEMRPRKETLPLPAAHMAFGGGSMDSSSGIFNKGLRSTSVDLSTLSREIQSMNKSDSVDSCLSRIRSRSHDEASTHVPKLLGVRRGSKRITAVTDFFR